MSRGTVVLRLGLVLGSLVLALAGAELALRLRSVPDEDGASAEAQLARSARTPLASTGDRFTLLGLVRPSPVPEIVYELKPNQQGVFKGQSVRINNLGMRGGDASETKPPGTLRIAGLGDSVMFGWGVGEDEIYVRRVERALNAAAPGGRRYEFLNFAVPGYNTVMEVATFEHKAMRFAPDLVVVHFVGNDLGLPHFLMPPVSTAGFHSYLLAALSARLRGAPDPESSDLESPELVHAPALPAGTRREAAGRYAAMTGRTAYDQAMARLAALARERGIPVLVMRLGDKTRQGEDVSAEAARRNGLRAFNAGPAFIAYLKRQGLAGGRDAWAKNFKLPDDGHPNALGHAIYAEALLGELDAMGFTKR